MSVARCALSQETQLGSPDHFSPCDRVGSGDETNVSFCGMDKLMSPCPLQEVDGESLLSLNPERMVKLMDLKTGPALRIYNKITALKQQVGLHPL